METENKTIGERIRQVRRDKKMNQTDFGKTISVSQNYLSAIEKNDNLATDKIIKLICLIYGVSEDWLRNGEGPMYSAEDSDSERFRQAATGIEMADDKRAMAALEVYWSLSPEDRKIIWKMFDQIYEKAHKKKSSD